MVGRLDGPVAFQSVGRFVSGPGWRHMRRTMDQHELVFVRRGVLPIRVGERRMHIAAHEVALFPLGVEHAGTESITADLEFYWMHSDCRCVPLHRPMPAGRLRGVPSAWTRRRRWARGIVRSVETAMTGCIP